MSYLVFSKMLPDNRKLKIVSCYWRPALACRSPRFDFGEAGQGKTRGLVAKSLSAMRYTIEY